MQNVELTYETIGSRNYLCVKISEEISSYQLKMLENNRIFGLLPVHSRILNGVYCLEYDITGMSRLQSRLEGKSLSWQEARLLLAGIAKAIVGTEEYLLSNKQCLLDQAYLYCAQDGTPGLVYLPLKEGELSDTEQIRNFYKDILLNYLTADGNPYFMELLRYVILPDFSISGLTERLMVGKEAEERKVQEPQTVSQPASVQTASVQTVKQEPEKEKLPQKEKMPQKTVEKKAEKASVPEKQAPVKEAANPWGIAVPGMAAPMAAPVTPPEKKEGKQGVFGGLFSHKKKEEPEKTKPAAQPVSKPERVAETGKNVGKEAVWRGTVMVAGEETSSETTTLWGEKGTGCPKLRHRDRLVLMEQFPFTIGKQNADYVIAKSVISRRHVSFTKKEDGYYICDENSSNHTYVNGKQLAPYTEVRLASGDVIRLADEEMTFMTESGE